MTRHILNLLLILILPGLIQAQRLLFQHLGTDKGLIQSDVNNITQDKQGNIWIGTNAGISVYDGKKFTNYDDLRQLGSLRTNKILCDKKGVVWIANDNSILKFDGSFKRIFRTEQPNLKRIFQLEVDRENNKYFIYNREIFKIDCDTDSITKWSVNIPSRSPILVLSIDHHNSFWLCTANAEVFRMIDGRVTRMRVPAFLEPFHGTSPLTFLTIRHTAQDLVSFTTTKGVFLLQEDSLVHVGWKYCSIPPRSRTNVAINTSQNSVWVGSDSGVFKIDEKGAIKQFTKINGFTNNNVNVVFEDAERNLWFGTYGNGLFQLSTEAVSLYDQVDQIDLSNIESIVKTDQGHVILGSYSQGIVSFKNNHFIKNPWSSRPVFFRYVTGIAAKGENTFIGTFGQGMFEYDHQASTIRRSRLNVPEHFVNAVLPYKRGFLVFAGGRYLYSFDNNYKLITKKDFTNLSSLFAITDSTFIFVQNGKIDIYDPGLNLLKKNLFTEITSRISCLEFYDKYIIAGTIGEGLFLYDHHYRFLKKLPSRSNIIYSMRAATNHLFVGSNVGLSKVPLAGFPNVQSIEDKLIFTGECKEEGILAYNNDTIMVTSSKGLFVINTTTEDLNFTRPVISLKNIQFKNNEDRRASDYTETIVHSPGEVTLNIPYDKNELQVSLKGVSQSSPEQLQFKFILENYETKWNTTDNGDLIRYTNLPAGNYVFKARLYSKGNSSSILTIPFTIDKPIQAKWWFQALVFSLFVVFAILLLKIFNTLNQRYIQTKWINKSTNELQSKRSMIRQLIKTTKTDLQLFKDVLIPTQNQTSTQTERYLDFYFKTTLSSLDLLWEKDFIALGPLNHTLKTFAEASFNTVVEVSHDSNVDNVLVESHKAEKIIRLFSLFIFYSIETNQARQFALTSKIRLGNQLFLKIYSNETVPHTQKNTIHRHLETMIKEMNRNNFSVEFIQSQNLGHMVIVNLNLDSTNVIDQALQRAEES